MKRVLKRECSEESAQKRALKRERSKESAQKRALKRERSKESAQNIDEMIYAALRVYAGERHFHVLRMNNVN
jgi:ribosomal protein S19